MQNTLNPQASTGEGTFPQTWFQVAQSYYQLTKPRIILLLLITTAAGMALANQAVDGGTLTPFLFWITLLGGLLAAASANTINCFYDRDIDATMVRTQHRPLPSGRIRPRDALVFAFSLAALSFGLLATYANLGSALLAMSGIGCYVLVYTFWLKRTSTQNIVIGGAAGAIPPLVGWCAVTGHLDWGAWVLFGILLLWTPPHFWALALMIKDDYEMVGVPMLPVVKGTVATARQIWVYTLLLVPSTILLVYPLGLAGLTYGISAIILGGVFIGKVWRLLQDSGDRQEARSVFKYSIIYMMLLCAAMGIDLIPVLHF